MERSGVKYAAESIAVINNKHDLLRSESFLTKRCRVRLLLSSSFRFTSVRPLGSERRKIVGARAQHRSGKESS